MTEPNEKPTAEESYEFGSPGSGTDNPWLERTLGREAFYLGGKRGDKSDDLKKDGEARCFIIRRPQFHNIYGGVQFWLQVGLRDDLTPLAAPFFSAARIDQGWTYQSKKTGKHVLGIKNGPVKACALARLVKKCPEIIAPLRFKGIIQTWPAKDGVPGEVKRDYRKLFAVEAYEVLFEYAEVPDPARLGQKKRIVVVDPTTKKPKYTINPKPYIFELNEPWWDQLRSKVLVSPKFSQALTPQVADIDGDKPVAPPKQRPTDDPSKIVLKLFAKTDEKDPSRASYLVDFSAALTIDSSAIEPVDELPTKEDGYIDWEQIYPPMTEEQATELFKKFQDTAFDMDGPPPSDTPPPPSDADAPPPASDDDIPF